MFGCHLENGYNRNKRDNKFDISLFLVKVGSLISKILGFRVFRKNKKNKSTLSSLFRSQVHIDYECYDKIGKKNYYVDGTMDATF